MAENRGKKSSKKDKNLADFESRPASLQHRLAGPQKIT